MVVAGRASAPVWARSPDECMTTLPSRHENGGSRMSCSPYARDVRSVFEAVPARLSGSASIKLVSRHGAVPSSAVAPSYYLTLARNGARARIVAPATCSDRSALCCGASALRIRTG